MLLYTDLETFCATDIKHGAHKYAETAEVLLWGYAIDDAPAKVWDVTSGSPMPDDLKAAWEKRLEPGNYVVMHNGMNFDRVVLAARGFGSVPAEHVIDTMVVAYEHALPGGLGDLCKLFRLPEDKAKDKDGARLVRSFCKPLPKNCRLQRYTAKTHPEEWARFVNYCRLDIESMREVWKKLPKWNLTAQERKWQVIDAEINTRGMRVDVELAEAAVETAKNQREMLAERTRRLTGDRVSSANQRDAFIAFVNDEFGIELPDAKTTTLEKLLADSATPDELKELIRTRLASCRISVQKFTSLVSAVNRDGRLRGTMQFRGASRTGRISGRIFQPQNLVRPTMKNAEIDEAIRLTKLGLLDLVYPDAMQVLPNLLRGEIVAPEGKKLVVCDFSNVEGRVLAWLAGEEWKIRAFKEFDAGHGHDLYKLTYARAFGVSPESVTKGQRQIGKVLELALGYGGGPAAFATMARGYGLDLHEMASSVAKTIDPVIWKKSEEWYPKALEQGFVEGMDREVFIACDAVKRAWRNANPKIVALWALMGDAIARGVAGDGPAKAGQYLTVDKKGAYLRIQLPSGRYLCYPRPVMEDGEFIYEGTNQVTRKWEVVRSWSGKCVENATQAVACDLLFNALENLDRCKYETVLTVHDEAICEVPDDPAFNVEEMKRLMCTLPDWGSGLPLAAAGFEAKRYRKD